MNGIERITQRIDADTQSQIDQLLTEAKAAAAQVTGKYQSQADREAAELATHNQKTAAEREERLVSVAQMEARKVTLGARQEMVEKAFDRALEKMCAMPDQKYMETVANLLAQAAPDGQGQVIFAKAERERIGAGSIAAANKLLGEKGKLSLAKETRDVHGGFILVNGSVEVNCTFETLVRLQKGEMAGEVAKRLFPNA